MEMSNSCGSAKNSSDQAKHRSFCEEEAQNTAGSPADRFHQSNIILTFHRDVGHGRHDAQRREDQHDRDGGSKQAADTVIDLAFRFGELTNAVDVSFGTCF